MDELLAKIANRLIRETTQTAAESKSEQEVRQELYEFERDPEGTLEQLFATYQAEKGSSRLHYLGLLCRSEARIMAKDIDVVSTDQAFFYDLVKIATRALKEKEELAARSFLTLIALIHLHNPSIKYIPTNESINHVICAVMRQWIIIARFFLPDLTEKNELFGVQVLDVYSVFRPIYLLAGRRSGFWIYLFFRLWGIFRII